MNGTNPFLNAIVADPWDQPVSDVPRIHARAFAACRSAFDRLRATGASHSVLVHGEPGSGKTHLLARVRSELAQPPEPSDDNAELGDAAPPMMPAAIFSSMRLRSGSRMICRHVRRSLTRDLLRPDSLRLTQLDWLLIHRAAPHVNQPARAHQWYARLRRAGRGVEAEREADELLRRLGRDLQLPGNLATILRVWALGRHPRAVSDWLAEGTLPDAERETLGLLPMPEEADPEEEALDLLEALSRLAGPRLPLVLCFDQVEALQTHPGDREGPFSFGRMISALHDRLRHALLITGVQSSFLETLREFTRTADMDRLAETVEVLEPLDAELAPLLVAARLDNAPALRRQRQSQEDSCWPIGQEVVRQFVSSSATGGCTPRRLIAFCRQQIDHWRTGKAAPPPSTDQFLGEQFERQFDAAFHAAHVKDSLQTLQHGLPLLLMVAGTAVDVASPTRSPAASDATATPTASGRTGTTGSGHAGAASSNGTGSPASDRTEASDAAGTSASGGEPSTRGPNSRSAPHPATARQPTLLGTSWERDQEPRQEQEKVPEADFTVAFPEGVAAVCVCHDSGNRLTGRLKRLRRFVERRAASGGNLRLVLLRDARLPIPPTARKAREHLAVLGRHGVPFLRPSPEALAALEALRNLLSDAKSGDLASDGRTIAESSVQQWLKANLPDPLRELARQFHPGSGNADETAATEPDPCYDALLETLQQHHVLRLAEVAERTDCDLGQLHQCLERHRDRFGVLTGPPIVVFERVEGA